ncbi:MAG TPA: OmpA family protein [Accumulibacter sp.]|nr:OmpA family protein [Accumulibacter sp.]
MKSKLITTLLASLGLFAAVGAAQAQSTADRVYVIDQRGDVVVSGTGLCWRTGFWTPAAAAKDPAGCQCDRDLLPKEACDAAAPARTTMAPAVSKPSEEKITLAADALFDFDKATLRPEGRAKLDEVASKAKAFRLELVTAKGHTDRLGSDAYNQKLSERRAAAVKSYLVSKGIPADRISTEGYGEKRPVTKPGQCLGPKSKKVIECLQPDRRVEIQLIGNK